MNTVTTERPVKPFAQSTRLFLLNLMAQRRKLIINGENRSERKSSLEAIRIISAQLNAYEYSTDISMARFFINHYNTIAGILPGKGSGCHQSRMSELFKIYNQAVIITSRTMKTYSYYRVTNDHGEAFVKTSDSDCTIISLSYEGRPEIKTFETSFKRYNGDVIVEISREIFQDGVRKVIDQLKRSLGL